MLSALVPVEQGGMGATLTDLSNMIRVLSASCAATGSVLAMHTEQMFSLLKHGNAVPAASPRRGGGRPVVDRQRQQRGRDRW